MKKLPLVLIVLAIFIGCDSGGRDNDTKEFVVVDQDSNKILNSYEYSRDTNVLLKTSSYDQSQRLEKDVEYEYDCNGYLVKTVETMPGSTPRIITYDTEAEYDAAGRLVKLVRTSSEGEIVETCFGYDEAGTLRGVKEEVNKGSVLMKDY